MDGRRERRCRESRWRADNADRHLGSCSPAQPRSGGDRELAAKTFRGVIIRGPGASDVKLGGANVFIAPVTAGDGVNTPPTPPIRTRSFRADGEDIDAAPRVKARASSSPRADHDPAGVRICFIRGPQGISDRAFGARQRSMRDARTYVMRRKEAAHVNPR